MLSLRCRLLQYAVFVGINGWYGNNIFFRYFLFHFPNKSILSLPCAFSPLTMYNKTIIGFGFCDMQNYQCLGKSYKNRETLIIPHITKTSSNIIVYYSWQQLGILLSLSKIARAHFLNLIFFPRTMKTRILREFFKVSC